ncbi:MAG: aminopeptidase [Chitinophagales bacterium]|jgi:aminopeptidase|nr:aminopeptidase [Chitinophagales bacterium]
MKTEFITRYAELIAEYCIEVKPKDKILIKSTYLAEDLINALIKAIQDRGGFAYCEVQVKNQNHFLVNYSNEFTQNLENPINNLWTQDFQGFVNIMAPFLKEETIDFPIDLQKQAVISKAQKHVNSLYMRRTGDRSLKRTLLQFPTHQAAIDANMSLEAYENFVIQACMLDKENPSASWRELGKNQQVFTDYLNSKSEIRYVGSNIDLTFKTKGRTWINSDGKTNMPSGEIYTSPVDDSANGWVKFTLPSSMHGKHFRGISMEVKDGVIVKWEADEGKEALDKIMAIPGANRFGEAAIGTNYQIQQATNNILYDEKIGGTVHLALGQAYHQCGGINESQIHWDLITSMADGEIYADGELCYQNGRFTIG